MKKNKFYITTPIYYVNWVPHIWHFYSSIIADIIARYNRINWKETRFTTWVDENSQKALQVAESLGMGIESYLDMMAEKHKLFWDSLDISYSDFIRTTEKRHHDLVREVLQKSFDNWDIYEWVYEWKYCVWCEAFKKDDDLIEKSWKLVCPDHLKEPDIIKEKNYFFRLSKYQDKLLKYYEENPEFVIPQDRFNEVIAFVRRWLEDFSISRETNKFWVRLPFDESQVTYVWYDALFNYVTSCVSSRWWDKNNTDFINESDFWPADLHIVWKDIIRFHAIYWPAMLMSAWYELPKQILTTWFFTVDWQKMSKSLWNVIDPVDYSKKVSKDALILYLLSSFNIWQDWDFDHKQAILTYNAKLANNLWNLLNRVVVLSLKLKEESWKLDWEVDDNIKNKINNYVKQYDKSIENYWLKESLDLTFSFLDDLNKFTDEKQPWNLIKVNEEEAKRVLYTIAEWLRQVWLKLYPFFPEKMWEMFLKLGLENYKERLENGELEKLRDEREIFYIKEKWNNLFERLELEEEKEDDIKKEVNLDISINPKLENDWIKYKAAIYHIPQITKKRSSELKKYIEDSLRGLDISKIENSEFVKKAEDYYKKAWLKDVVHPSKALLNFVKKSWNIPNINKIVDAYNIVTLNDILSVWVHDIDKIKWKVNFDYTSWKELYIPLTKVEKVKVWKWEYACMDEEKILCRMDYKQCDETKISENTKTMFIYVQWNSEVDEKYVLDWLKDVCETIKKFCGGGYEIL